MLEKLKLLNLAYNEEEIKIYTSIHFKNIPKTFPKYFL